MLGGAVLHRRQDHRATLLVVQCPPRFAQPALATPRVDQPPLEHGRQVRAVEDIALFGAILLGLELDRIQADQLVAGVAAELDEGRVHVEQPEIRCLQRSRER